MTPRAGSCRSIRMVSDEGESLAGDPDAPLAPGPLLHDSPAAAMATLEELEETARLVCLTASPTPPLTEEQIQELRVTFAARW